MYETIFGLSRRPFASAADADCFFPAVSIEAARQTLFRTIDRGEGPALLVGPAGSGKSLLLMVLAEQFAGRFTSALLTNGRINTRRELLQAILYELGIACRDLEEGELRLSLIDFLSSSAPPATEPAVPRESPPADSREGLLLLIDEAHLLSFKLLEEVRLITNFIRGGQPKVRLVLAGSPLLEERFASPKLETFNQRIAARCYLQALDRGETSEYIKAQIDWAGGQDRRLFSSEALDAAFQATQGVPRLINQVCDHALLLACAAGNTCLDKALIEEAWADLQQLPTPWNRDSAPANLAHSDATVIEFGVLDDDSNTTGRSIVSGAPQAATQPGQTGHSPANDLTLDFENDEAEIGDSDAELLIGEETSDEDCAAVPFSVADFAGPSLTDMHNPLGRLAHVEEQLSAIDIDVRQEATAGTQNHFSSADSVNPFSESFAEEEVILDPFAMTAGDALANRPLVRSEEGRRLGALLKPLPERSVRQLTVATVECGPEPAQDAIEPELRLQAIDPDAGTGFWPSHEADDDASASEPALIVIEDDPAGEHQVTIVRRQDFDEAFDNLRHG